MTMMHTVAVTTAEVAAKLRQFNEWRRGDYEPSEQPEPPNPYEVSLAIDAAVEMIDRLGAAEKERDDVAQQLVQSEIGKRKISEARDALQAEVGKLKAIEVTRCVKINGYIVDNARLAEEVERLRAEVAHIKEVEFPRKAQAVADGWRGKCERLEAKIAEMERQEPVMWVNSSNIDSSRINKERGGRGDQHTCSETQTTYHDTRLYALPGAKGEEK